MAAERDELLQELCALMFSLAEEDMVDTRFMYNYAMKRGHGCTFFRELVEIFCRDIQEALSDLSSDLEDRYVCYEDIYDHYLKIKDNIECVGASAMRLGVEELQRGILGTSRRECILAHLHLQQGFEDLRPHLGTILRLERRIIYLHSTITGDSDDDE